MVADGPKISVIIPAFDVRRWVGEAIESALEQTRKPHEIIVVDDGSTDGTADVLARYEASDGAISIKVIKQDNAGVSSARNRAMADATGNWFAFLDADDKWSPNKLERLSGLIDLHPDVDLFYHDAFIIDEEGALAGLYRYEALSCDDAAVKLLMRNCILTSTVLLKAEAARETGLFREDLKRCEDWDYWLRVTVGHRIEYIAEPLTFYRRLPGSLVRSNLDDMLDDFLKVIEDGGARLGIENEELGRFKASAYRDSALRRLAAYDSRGARADLARAKQTGGRPAKNILMYASSLMPKFLQRKMLELKRNRDSRKAKKIMRTMGYQ